MTSAADIDALMQKCQIRMIARRYTAKKVADELESSERPVDVVKAFRVLVNGKQVGNGPGFALVFLTNQRIIVAHGGIVSLPLAEIASISDLTKGKFTWDRSSGERWRFEHARGIIRSNGNRDNTQRFYEAMKSEVPTS
jgi:hypothetical protein